MVINLLAIVLAIEIGCIFGVFLVRYAWNLNRQCRQCHQELGVYRLSRNLQPSKRVICHKQPNLQCWRYIKERNKHV